MGKMKEFHTSNALPVLKGNFYRTVIYPAMLSGSKSWPVKGQHLHKLSVAEMHMLRWMIEHTRMDCIWNEKIREKMGVAPIDEKLCNGCLRWYSHIHHRGSTVYMGNSPVPNTKRGRERPKLTCRFSETWFSGLSFENNLHQKQIKSWKQSTSEAENSYSQPQLNWVKGV